MTDCGSHEILTAMGEGAGDAMSTSLSLAHHWVLRPMPRVPPAASACFRGADIMSLLRDDVATMTWPRQPFRDQVCKFPAIAGEAKRKTFCAPAGTRAQESDGFAASCRDNKHLFIRRSESVKIFFDINVIMAGMRFARLNEARPKIVKSLGVDVAIRATCQRGNPVMQQLSGDR